MKYRANELYHEQALDDTGTKIIDLNFKDPLSAIGLQFKGVNGGTSNKANWMSDVVTKIEIVDGSDVLLSLSLKQAQALQAYQTGKMPYINFEEAASKAGKDETMLLFGRYLWDDEYYLDLSKFANPQLKITTDEDVIRAMGATGWLTGSFKVSVTAFIIQEGAAGAKGFFMNKEVYNFTAATSGDEHVDLPRDHPFIAAMINSTVKQSDIYELISKMKISCDSDKFVPIDQYTHHYMEQFENARDPLSMRCILYRKDGEEPQFPIYYNPRANLMASTKGHVCASGWMWSGNMNLLLSDADGASVGSEEQIWTHVIGGSLHCSLYVPFGRLENPATYFPVVDWNEIKLILTQAAAGAVKVCLQQLRTYGA